MFGSFAGVPYAHYGFYPLSPYVPPFIPTFSVEVDWNDDGDFDDPNEDLSGNVISAEFTVGRDYASQLIGRSKAGSLSVQMFNPNGLYSSLNPASPLYGMLLPNRKVRVRELNSLRVLWTGYTQGPPEVSAQQGSLPKAQLSAVGPLAILGTPNLKVNPPAMVGANTGAVVNAILDAAEWPVGQRRIDTGDVVLGHWFVEKKGVVEALQEVEEAEGGFISEGTNWDIVWQSRYHRLYDARCLSVQAAYSDVDPSVMTYRTVGQEDPLRQVFNRIEVTVTPYVVAPSQVLWHLQETLTLLPGETRTVWAQLQGAGYVQAWTTPVMGIDITSVGVPYANLASSATPFARSMMISVTNNHTTLSTQVNLQARGVAVVPLDDLSVMREDTASQDKYNLRTFPFSSPWFFNTAYAESSADYTLLTYKDPHAVIDYGFPVADITPWLEAVELRLSDRISLAAAGPMTGLGVSGEFYIEGLSLKLERKMLPQASYILSPAAMSDPGYWHLDVSVLGTSTKLAY